MRGLNCGNCNRGSHPYVTAYEIAVKHGFHGTEEEWIDLMQSVYVARVTAKAGEVWSCSDSYETLVLMSQNKEVHLQTLDGKTAFLDGNDEEKITFRTQNYAADDGTVYDKYVLLKTGDGEYAVVDVSTDTGTITYDRLASDIQTSLGKADTALQEHQSLNSVVPRNQQSAKTFSYTQPIAIDGNGKLWGEEHKFVVNLTYNNTNTDKSSTDIYNAQNAGYIVVLHDSIGLEFPLEHSEQNKATFARAFDLTNSVNVITYTITGLTVSKENTGVSTSDPHLFITESYDGDYYWASKTSAQILAALEEAEEAGIHKHAVFIDHLGTQCNMCDYPSGSPLVVKFFTVDSANVIIYSISDTGLVTFVTVPIGS